ncbi:MAG: restriction endonuclease subunit S [Allorhizobium sp.]
MSELPKGWVEATVSEVGSTTEQAVLTGPFGASLGKADFRAAGVPVFTIGCLGNGYIIEEKLSFISDQKAEELVAYRLREGDLMFSRMATVGRVGFVPPKFSGSIFNYHLMRLRLCEAVIEPRFFYHYIKGAELVAAYLADKNRGATRDGINTKLLEQLPISLPPLAEQKRIVATLDALNAKSARARTELTRIETLVSRYKQAVLSKAFSGELTLAEVSNWASCTLGELALDVRYGTAEKCTYAPDLTPVLRIPNVANGRIDLSDLKHASFNEKELRKLELLEGDLLIIRSNGSLDLVGRSAVVDAAAAGMLFAGYLIRVRLALSKAMPSFIQYWMQSLAVRRTIEDAAKSTSGVNNVNSQQLQALQLKLPSLEEQHEIVRRIESAFAKIDRLAKEAKRALELVGRLDEAILAKAFRGELVPQDENDEPAERLLARIRAEREAAPKGKRGRGAKE